MTNDGVRLRGRPRMLGGYAPLAVGAVLVTAAVAVVPSRVPDEIFSAASADIREVPEGETASGWGTGVVPCDDRDRQVPDDDYSPPCFEFSGSNGGATTSGVTDDEIVVSFRRTVEGDVIRLLADLAGFDLGESTDDLERTAEGLMEFFNENYEFYGRELVFHGYDGRGALLSELYGGGQEQAGNDALRVANDIGAFADVTGMSQPYADALSRNQVLNFNSPYLSREWYADRRPYAWSSVPDCTIVSEAASEYGAKKVLGRPVQYSPQFEGEERRVAIISPNNLEYQQCTDAGIAVIEEHGYQLDERLDYTLDLSQIQAQAPSLVSKLKHEGITSVAFAGDALMLQNLVAQADAQDYHPEWMVIGVGFSDVDLAGQFIDEVSPGQWDRAFGGTPMAAPPAPGQGDGYAAYTSVRDDEPSLLVEVLYAAMLPLAIGVQMAGPHLTPETFETGLIAYPAASGVAGTWNWTPGVHTPVVDMREVWWDPEAISPLNGQPGSYVDNGERYRIGEIPEGDPEVFP